MSSMNDGYTIKQEAEKIIQRRVLYASGLGLIPLPIVDIAGIFATQVLMIKEIADLYGVPFEKNRTESIIGVLVLDLATTGVVKSIPLFGSIFGGVTLSISAAAATYAIGRVFVKHFNQGGTLLNFDPQESRVYFRRQYQEGLLEDTNLPSPKPKRPWGTILGIWLFILLIVGGATLFVLRVWNNALPPPTLTEEYLAQQEKQAVTVPFLRSLEVPEIEKIIADFAPFSTEAKILEHIQSENTRFPRRFVLNRVQFTGSSNILSDADSRQQMEHIAAILKKHPELMIDIYGQTDSEGAQLLRQRVGRERARLLAETLTRSGIAPSRITANPVEVKRYPRSPQYWGAEIILRLDTSTAIRDTTNSF